MHIQSIQLQNIACFEEQTVDFTLSDGKPAKWVTLLGENGTGKSTILQMLSFCLLGRDMVWDVARGINWEHYSKQKNRNGKISIKLLVDKGDKKGQKTQNPYQIGFEFGKHIQGGVRRRKNVDDNFVVLNETLYSGDLTLGWFACGYGPWRTLSRQIVTRSPKALNETRKKQYRFATMYSADNALTNVYEWLLDLDFRMSKDDAKSKKIWNLAIQALEQILPGLVFKEITVDSEIVFHENGIPVNLNQLSDGYRSITAWIGDLIRRLIEANPNASNPLHAEGVVLVDEIDIHLHPKWQRNIVEEIRKLFPNLQFIVSTHSPFIAQDMAEEDKIIILKKVQDKIVYEENLESIKGWRVDQILTSNLFDLETTRDLSVHFAEKEYQELLNLQTRQRLSIEQTGRLKDLKDWLQKNKSLPAESIERNEVFAAARTLIDLMDEKLLETSDND